MAATLPSARASVPAWRVQLEALWSWWTGELAQLIPTHLGAMQGFARAPVVTLDGDAIVLQEVRPSGLAEVARAQLASLDLEGRRIALRSLLSGGGEPRSRVLLALGRDEALHRSVSLPLATEENLAQVLAFEMDRLTPFRVQDVYFGHRIASRDVAGGKLLVDLAVARRELVDANVAKLAQWGARIEGVVLAEDAVRGAAAIDLLPETARSERERGEGTLRLVALAATLVLLAVALALPIWQKRETAIALLPVAGKARQDAEATDTLARELDKLVADYNFLLSKKHAIAPALAVLEEVSRLLPDTTWVQQIDLRPAGKVREVQIAGETPSSSKLIEIFEQATTLRNAAPRGTVTRGTIPGTERFLLAAEVRPRPLPESVPAAPPPTTGPAALAPTTGAPAAPAPPGGDPARAADPAKAAPK